MTDPERVLRAIDILSPAFERHGLDELEVEVGELMVRLARSRPAATAGSPANASTAPASPSAASLPAAGAGTPGSGYPEPVPGLRFVTAPLTGVWYSAPSPGARPYVTLGAEIGAGAVVGLIEAMKLFNEIKADVGGRVTRILVESGTLVKRQQPLLEVDPG